MAEVDGVERIKFMSPHPKDMDADVLNVMKDYDNICNHVHLPLQAGSDRILQRMNRTYTQKDFLDLVDLTRSLLPDCTISTDIIVGFPGETNKEFQETLKVLYGLQ